MKTIIHNLAEFKELNELPLGNIVKDTLSNTKLSEVKEEKLKEQIRNEIRQKYSIKYSDGNLSKITSGLKKYSLVLEHKAINATAPEHVALVKRYCDAIGAIGKRINRILKSYPHISALFATEFERDKDTQIVSIWVPISEEVLWVPTLLAELNSGEVEYAEGTVSDLLFKIEEGYWERTMYSVKLRGPRGGEINAGKVFSVREAEEFPLDDKNSLVVAK